MIGYAASHIFKLTNLVVLLFQLIGEAGRVCGISEEDPTKLFIQFRNDEKIFSWLPRNIALPSRWMEPFKMAQSPLSVNKKELMELFAKEIAFFVQAAENGDLDLLKLLHRRYNGIVDDRRIEDGRTALHLASLNGHKDVAEWLLDVAKADLEIADEQQGFRAIHFALEGLVFLSFLL